MTHLRQPLVNLLELKDEEKLLSILFIYFKKFFLHLFIFERERQSTSREGAERERETESEAVSTEPGAGLKLTNRDIVT